MDGHERVVAARVEVTRVEVTRVEVPCDRAHLDQLRAPDSDIAVPANPDALASVAALLAHRRHAA